MNRKFAIKHLFSLLAFSILILFAVGSTNDTPKDPNAWKTGDNSIMAYIMMEDFVKRELKSPGSAKFPGVFDGQQDHVTRLEDHKYRIISYVDAQNSFGALIRTKFIGEIQQISDEDWRLLSLNLL